MGFLVGHFCSPSAYHKSADGCWPVGAGFTAGRTLSLADSTGDMGHKEERVETLLGTRSEPANLAAIHRGHKPLPTCCCTRLHNRQRPKLVRRGLQRMPQSKQSGSSRLLFGSMQGKIRAAHIVPRLLAWANTRAVVSANGHHGRQGTLRADSRTDRQKPRSGSLRKNVRAELQTRPVVHQQDAFSSFLQVVEARSRAAGTLMQREVDNRRLKSRPRRAVYLRFMDQDPRVFMGGHNGR